MPLFEYRFVNPATGRKRKASRQAFDEADLRATLAADGIDPHDVSIVPETMASDRQMQLLADRGVAAPPGLTMAEASALISNFFDGRPVAEERDFAVARRFRVEVARFASKATIYRAILADLVRRGDMAALGAWYAYRVYRNGFDRSAPGIADPFDGRFAAIGRRIAGRAELAQSLRGAATRSTADFRFFGRFVTPDGAVLHGDSDRSDVYRFVIGELRSEGLLAEPKPAPRRDDSDRSYVYHVIIDKPTGEGPPAEEERPPRRNASEPLGVVEPLLRLTAFGIVLYILYRIFVG